MARWLPTHAALICWPGRLRLCFIGQREAGCMLALLDPEAMRSVLTHVLMDDYQPCS